METLIRTWENKVLVVNEEVSMMPSEALNMQMYRAMWDSRDKFAVDVDEYAQIHQIFGRMPMALFLGDFLRMI